VGIRAIEYRPWKGDRTDPNRRWLVITKHVFQKNIRAKAVIVLLIFGMMLAHAFPIIGAVLFPHDGVTDEDMVGSLELYDPGTDPENYYNVTEGDLQIEGDLKIWGNITVKGFLHVGSLMDERIALEIENETGYPVDREIDGELTVFNGSIRGLGVMNGGGISFTASGLLGIEGTVIIFGSATIGNLSEEELGLLMMYDTGNGTGEIPPELLDLLANSTIISGSGTISGYGNVSGNGEIEGVLIHGEPPTDTYFGYLTSLMFIIFSMLLAAIICADVISSDLANSSFVLYFSRPVRSLDYLLGKIMGLTWVMWLFCLLPPIVYVLVMMGTQSGDNFSDGLRILGKTVIVGLVTAFYFLPFGLMMSSFTKSKAYAGIGIFMSFFVLLIISQIFADSSDKWSLISPLEVLFNFYRIMFNGAIPEGITSGQVGGSILAFTVIPMAIVIFWIQRKGAGK